MYSSLLLVGSSLIIMLFGAGFLVAALTWYVRIALKHLLPDFAAPNVLLVVGLPTLLFGFAAISGGPATWLMRSLISVITG